MAADVTGTTGTDNITITATSGFAQVNEPATATLSPFHETLPEELRAHPALKDYKDLAGLAKSHVEQQKLIGGPRVPKPEDPPEVHARYRAARGVPEASDKYGLTWPTLPEGMAPWAPEVQAGFLEVAHKAGLAPGEVTPLVDWYAGLMISQRDAAKNAEVAARREAVATLEKKWGPQAGPLFKRNLGLANGFMDKFLPGAHPLRGQLNLDNPWLVEAFAAAGEVTLEDVGIEGAEYESLTQEAVQAKLDAARNDPKHPINDPNHPGHQAALNERLELLRKLPGGREPILTLG